MEVTALAPRFVVPDERYAVVLNGNAGRVTPRLVAALRRVLPSERVILTRSQEHAREVLEGLVAAGVKTVFAGGGDGTIVDVINNLVALRRPDQPLPAVGVLRLGTGNALAHWLGSATPAKDLGRWAAGQLHKLVPVRMVEAEGTLFPFAGLGHDAAVLNDYNWLKKKVKGTFWEALVKGIPGYILAGYLKTIPNYLLRRKPRVTVVNLGRPAQRIDVDGHPRGAPIPAGKVIYQGGCTLLGTATTPLYGYGMKMFPHATKEPGRFQLRILDMSALQAGIHFLDCWRGRLTHPGCFDYIADRVRVSFDDPMPYQLGGEASGYRKEITFAVNELPIELVSQG
jgi:diacylglycerol kinase family enzyme